MRIAGVATTWTTNGASTPGLNVPLAQAARRLLRLGVRAARNDPESPLPDDPTLSFLTEIGMLNLVAVEQLIQLVESITPDGAGAAAPFLVPAFRAAQERLARGARKKEVAR